MRNQQTRLNQEKILANWLQEIREQGGLSQEALGLQIGKGQSDIAKIENASKRLTVLDLLEWMRALDVPLERLHIILENIYSSGHSKKSLWNKK